MTAPMSALCRDCLSQGTFERRCPTCGSPRLLSHPELATLSMAHLDCDAFYASVEKRDRPEYRDLPVIVGGGVRGVVTTCCYIARIFGVRSAMPMFKALKACPQAIVISPDFSKYRAESQRIMALMRDLTPLVQPLSLDEAWMDLSGTERLHGAPPVVTLAQLQARVEAEVGITVSIGLAPNKFLAKIASDLDKPRGFSVIGELEAKTFLSTKPVGILPGVGPAMVASLEAANFRTVGDIATADLKVFASRFGANGLRLHGLAQGKDTRSVNPDQVRKSISAETTFAQDLASYEALDAHLTGLADRVASQARAGKVGGRVVTLKLRTSDFKILTRRKSLSAITQTARMILATARDLLLQELANGAVGRRFRLVGVGISELHEPGEQEADFFAADERRVLAGEQTADAIRARFGALAVTSARALTRNSSGQD